MKKQSIAIYNPYLETRGGGEKVCLAMAEILSKDYEVTLVTRKSISSKDLGGYFDLDLSKCHLYILSDPSGIMAKMSSKLHLPGRLRNLIHEREDYKRLKAKNYSVFVNNCYKSAMPNPSKQGIYMCMFPQEYLDHSDFSAPKRMYHAVMDGLEKLLYGKTGRAIIDTYQTVTVNSSFTRSWVEKLWHMSDQDVEILYPICDNMSMPNVKREKIILNVGRFFANSGENHYKCQDKLLEAFKEMRDLHKKGWQLHFAGSAADDIDSLKYLIKLIGSAQGYPVFFHISASFQELKELYNKSSIYWHATGWGSDADSHPEKQEHFGISTVEAMSAGSVPVVIDSAGQKETLSHGVDGYRWKTKKDLKRFTETLANDEAMLNKFSKRARLSAKKFNKPAFAKALGKIATFS